MIAIKEALTIAPLSMVKRKSYQLFFVIILQFIALNSLASQEKEVKGAITYIAGASLYTSLGRNEGVQDSTLLFVLAKGDTVGVLKVFATSSKSSVCRIVQSKRAINIGDTVFATVVDTPKIEKVMNENVSVAPSHEIIKNSIDTTMAGKAKPTEDVKLFGRVSVQYSTSINSQTNLIATQPGVVLNMRGAFSNTPFSFTVYGNFRSYITGTESPFAQTGRSQTRLYRISAEYSDSLYRVSLGRIIPMYAPSVGYIDGLYVSRSVGEFVYGATAGLQPDYAQRTFSTDYKKFSIFGNYQSAGAFRSTVSLSYSRTYFHSLLDQEMVSSSMFGSITKDLTLSAQGEISLRRKSGSNFILSPRLSTFFSNLTYRISSFVTLGGGYTAWSPNYSYSSIQSVPDSMLDNSTRGNLTATLNVYFPYGISFYNTYSPRSSEESFGKEFSNYSSVAVSNVLNQGIYARISYSINSTVVSKTRGIGATVQQTFGRGFDVIARYQYYIHDLQYYSNSQNSQTYGIDVTAFVIEHLSFWGSVERANNFGTSSYNIISELSWRF